MLTTPSSSAARAMLLALLLFATGCVSGLTVRGRATVGGGSARGHAGVRVDGDGLAGLLGLVDVAASESAEAHGAVEGGAAARAEGGAARGASLGADATASVATAGGAPAPEGEDVRVTASGGDRSSPGAASAAWSAGAANGGSAPVAGSASGSPGGVAGGADHGSGSLAGSASADGGPSAGSGALPGGAASADGRVSPGGAAARGGVVDGTDGGSSGGAARGRSEAERVAARRARVGGGARLGGLVSGGVRVDGVLVGLADITPMRGLAAGGGAASPGAVRIDVPGAVVATAALDRGGLPAEGGETRLVVRVEGDPTKAPARARLRVHLVIDRSDSMASSWEQALASARGLVSHLGPDDLLQIVAYGSSAEEVLALGPVGDGRAALEALRGLRASGYTNIEAGLEMAYGAAATTPPRRGDSVLVILVSDGVPNVGAFGATEVGRLAAEARRSVGCTTTVVGLGADFDADLLRAVAREGRGGYHVAATAAALEPALLAELGLRDRVAARDLSLRVTVPRGVEVTGVVDGEAGVEVDGREISLGLPVLYASEERTLVIGLSVPAGSAALDVASVQIGFRDEASGRQRRGSRTVRAERGSGAVDAAAALAVLDAELASTLEAAAAALSDNQPTRAAELLEAQAAREAEACRALAGAPRLGRRSESVGRVAAAIEFYGPGASDADRRMVVRALGGLAITLGR